MVSVTIPTLHDIHETLHHRAKTPADAPCHVGAFSAWVAGDVDALRGFVRQAYSFEGQARHPEHAAALGFGAAAGALNADEAAVLRDEVAHLAGRDFFAPGRPLRFEADGVALLGVALGVAATGADGSWLVSFLTRACNVASDPWQQGLACAARLASGEIGLRIAPADLAVALANRGIGVLQDGDLEAAWKVTASLRTNSEGPARDAVRLAVFDHIVATASQVAINAMSRIDLIKLLQNVSRSLKLWQYEQKGRTPLSVPGRWDIENEYHVQAFLWVVLAPIFSDLEDEENLPSVGHKHPRADFGVPSLRTIVEVKFMRSVGQRACANIIEEVAADASLYLSQASVYDNIIAVVWDDCAQTEQHHELRSGLESIRGVSAAIILSRPAKMKRLG